MHDAYTAGLSLGIARRSLSSREASEIRYHPIAPNEVEAQGRKSLATQSRAVKVSGSV